MSKTVGISTGIAERYATALFDLTLEGKEFKALEADLEALEAVIQDNQEFSSLITSPLYSRDEQGSAVAAIAHKMKLSPLMSNTLSLMAQKRRLFVLPQLIATLRARLAEERGEITAEVVSAKALTKTQLEKLAKSLKGQVGKDVVIQPVVNQEIIGGLIVKIGSRMVDTSIRSKLNALQNTMKEVG